MSSTRPTASARCRASRRCPAAGYSLQVIVVTFEENRMTLRVPVDKAASSGLRKLAREEAMKEALDTLKGRARIKRTMWSRRAQEYEAKINSGDPVAIAEVVRDLHRNAGQPDQSFSERQIYEQAMDRLAAELAAIDRTDKAGGDREAAAAPQGRLNPSLSTQAAGPGNRAGRCQFQLPGSAPPQPHAERQDARRRQREGRRRAEAGDRQPHQHRPEATARRRNGRRAAPRPSRALPARPRSPGSGWSCGSCRSRCRGPARRR